VSKSALRTYQKLSRRVKNQGSHSTQITSVGTDNVKESCQSPWEDDGCESENRFLVNNGVSPDEVLSTIGL
jgi:hypothetical protein